MTTSPSPDWRLERTLWRRGYGVLAGVDEAGRGALAGPVVAAAVVLPYGDFPFRDSKTLAPAAREALAEEVRRHALAWAVGLASAAEVDRLNVLQATHLAARRALFTLAQRVAIDGLVTDFLRLPFPGPVLAIPKADAASVQVAAASLLAKTVRDALMRYLEERYPAYGFARHKGYGSSAHLRALSQHGPCPEHRRSFGPVRQRVTPLVGSRD
jgi:ribonuclease HII